LRLIVNPGLAVALLFVESTPPGGEKID